MVMGTAQYISPEQAAGQEAVPASDIYSLGVVAYECLAGTLPFPNENAVAMALRTYGKPHGRCHRTCHRWWPGSSCRCWSRIRTTAFPTAPPWPRRSAGCARVFPPARGRRRARRPRPGRAGGPRPGDPQPGPAGRQASAHPSRIGTGFLRAGPDRGPHPGGFRPGRRHRTAGPNRSCRRPEPRHPHPPGAPPMRRASAPHSDHRNASPVVLPGGAPDCPSCSPLSSCCWPCSFLFLSISSSAGLRETAGTPETAKALAGQRRRASP